MPRADSPAIRAASGAPRRPGTGAALATRYASGGQRRPGRMESRAEGSCARAQCRDLHDRAAHGSCHSEHHRRGLFVSSAMVLRAERMNPLDLVLEKASPTWRNRRRAPPSSTRPQAEASIRKSAGGGAPSYPFRYGRRRRRRARGCLQGRRRRACDISAGKYVGDGVSDQTRRHHSKPFSWFAEPGAATRRCKRTYLVQPRATQRVKLHSSESAAATPQ
jgi:hypothetical protein